MDRQLIQNLKTQVKMLENERKELIDQIKRFMWTNEEKRTLQYRARGLLVKIKRLEDDIEEEKNKL